MKKKIIFVSLVSMIALGLVACGNKDSSGKPFKASLSKSRIILDSEYKAAVQLRTNKNATYEVQNQNGNDVQSDRKTKSGKVEVTFHKPGKYTVIAKSDNGKVEKQLPLQVVPYTIKLDRATSSVGPIQFKIKSIEYRQMEKPKEPNSDALFNLDDFESLNKNYYQVKINYEVRNNSDTTIDPSVTLWNFVDDEGTEFQTNGSVDSYLYDSAAGGSKIAPKSHRSGVAYMISNEKFSVRNLKINVGDIYTSDNDDEPVYESGVANLN